MKTGRSFTIILKCHHNFQKSSTIVRKVTTFETTFPGCFKDQSDGRAVEQGLLLWLWRLSCGDAAGKESLLPLAFHPKPYEPLRPSNEEHPLFQQIAITYFQA